MPDRPETDTISDQDYQALINDFNSKNDDSFLECRLDQLFEKIVDEFPQNIALIHDAIEISFEQLNASANLIARGLVKRGLEHGDLVGLAVSRSMDLVAVMLAVLKVGAAYVPVDPSFPAQRIDQMIEDAGPRYILLNGAPTQGLARWTDICLSLDEVKDSTITDASNLNTDIHHRDLAYVIYTSGSTGRPKGVEISHGAAANFLTSLRKFEPGCDPTDRLLAITTISFDMSSLELFLPILSGATMIIANVGAVRDPRELIGLMRTHRATILQATPATWTMLLESGWGGEPRLSKIICGGEPLSRQLADRLLASADSVWNVYGPSETTYGSVGRVGDGDIVVGNPVVNGRIYVLNDDLTPVPMGCEGEVYIGGGSVSNGYRNKPDLTHSRFLTNPFHPGRFFRTGDLARFVGHGKLQVVGRIDGVVKIRGHRIDVGDIEAVLVDHPNVSEAVVVSRDDRLVAYCVARLPSDNPVSLDTVLRPWVAERLPSYMLPAFFVPMEALPLSPNEKVNRKALPDPMETIQNQFSVLPTSELEQQLQAIWSDILGHDRFGTEDSFFSIGGDSVRIVRMQAALEKQLGRSVLTPKLFEHFTIKALSAYLAGSEETVRRRVDSVVSRSLSTETEDIALVSMACRLPGGVTTPEDLWQVLVSGSDTTTDVPKERWDADKLYNADPDVDGTSYCRRGGFLDSVDSHDALFFGISPRESRGMDPEQHLMLELCWESFERAGYTKDRVSGSTTGIFIGVSNNRATHTDPADLKGHSITGSADATLSGRLSYTFNLQGPCLTVDTACSSSLVATHLACNALRNGECDMALAGGVSLLLNPGIHIEFSKLRGLSADGRCKAFSDDTDGTGFSEGAAIVVLKRLSDAQRDGDRIHAVLRGTATMHGGHSVGLTAPNGPRQETLIRTALARTALEPNDIDYVEAHGTATKLGDPIEATALAEVFGGERSRSNALRLGSVKSNLGHTQAAAGLVGLLKVVLSLENNLLPKTLHVTEPTRAVDWKSANIELVLENQPWQASDDGRLRRAGVSAFGIGGTIAHVVVEEYAGSAVECNGKTEQIGMTTPSILVLSGNNDSALRAQAEKLRFHIESGSGLDDDMSDVAYSLATSRTHFHHKMAVVAQDKQQVLQQLNAVSSGLAKLPDNSMNEVGKAGIAMLFTGQGSQRSGMGKNLYTAFPNFRNSMDEIAANFAELEHPLLDVMWAEPGSPLATLLNRTDFAQPALFALEVSLWRLWQTWGVKPAFLLGHSVGELAVAHAAGILNLTDACRLVLVRGRLMQSISKKGKTMAVSLSSGEVEAVIGELGFHCSVGVASYNTPSQTVIAGDDAAVEAIKDHLAVLGHKTKVLHSSQAFHSHHLDEITDEFRLVARTVRYSRAMIPIVSSMTGQLAGTELEDPEYWVEQIRRPVQFHQAFQTVVTEGANVFLELGPGPTLCGLGVACITDASQLSNALWLPSLKPKADESFVIRESIGKLYARNISIDWNAYFEPFSCQRVDLPTYAFQREVAKPAVPDVHINGSLQTNGVNGVTHDLGKFMFEMNWRPIEPAKAKLSGSWGLICPPEQSSWGKGVQEALSSTGIRLSMIKRIQEAERLDGVLFLWDSNDDVVSQAHDFVARALSQLQDVVVTGYTLPVVWITCHSVSTGNGDQPVQIGAGPLYGLMRTARSEHPELRLRLIDVDDVSQLTTLSAALMRNDLTEVAIRRDKLLTPHMEPARCDTRLSPTAGRPLLRTDGAVLITGGLGDIASRVARRLAKSHGVRDLVLLSRRGMKDPGAKSAVERLTKLGAKVTILAGDVADSDSLRCAMQIFTAERPLRGVVHAAGVVDPGTLSTLTPEKCASVFAPKVDGLWNLHQITRGLDLDVFVMFSSISGVMGLPGLANYAAANSFVDALAYSRRAQRLPATSLAYSTWDGDGMVTTLIPSTRAHLSQLGLGLIDPEIGLDILERAVRHGGAMTIAAVLDLDRLNMYYKSQGGIPPFLRSMLSRKEIVQPVKQAMTLRDMLAGVDPERHAGIVLRMVQATVANALDHTGVDELDPNRPLQDFGIDSLSAVLMRNHLMTLTGIALPPNVALLHPDLRSLSNHLLQRLLKEMVKSKVETTRDSLINMPAIRRGVLDPKIQFGNTKNSVLYCSGRPQAVLVTGPTGFVGAFMVQEFLKRSIDVYCLVRASSLAHAQERMIETLKQYSLWEPAHELLLHSIVGDLSQPLLGLNEAEFDDLADKVDSILHSGALVDWMRPLEDYIGPNILGTHEVLRLASHGRGKSIHFISTISTLPIHLGYGLTEDDGEYGYGTSKYLAERMIVAARFRGAMASSYRLPFVAASASSGHFRLDAGDFLNNLITGSLDLGIFPSIDADLSTVLPVDYLCGTIATVMTEDQLRIGEDYDFLNPTAPTFDQFFRVMGGASRDQAIVPFSDWHHRALEYAALNPKTALARITTIIDGYTDETAGALMKGNPVGKHVFGSEVYPAPSLDDKYVRRYLGRIMAAKAAA